MNDEYQPKPLTIKEHPGLSFTYRRLPTAPDIEWEVKETKSGVWRSDSSLSTAIAKMSSLPKIYFQK